MLINIYAQPLSFPTFLVIILEINSKNLSSNRLHNPYDLILIYLRQSELDQHLEALEKCGCDVTCINYMKKWKAFNKQVASSGPIQTGSGQSTYSAMFNRIMSTGSKFVMEGVKSLVVGTKNLPLTRITDNIMEQKGSPETDDYRYFDPKMVKQNESVQQKKNFQEVLFAS